MNDEVDVAVATETAGNDSIAQAVAAESPEAGSEDAHKTDAVAVEEAAPVIDAAALPTEEAAAAEAIATDNAGGEGSASNETSHEVHVGQEHDHEHHNHTDGEEEHEDEDEEEDEEEDYSLEDVYNPRNLTWDELEMVLYEWEEEIESVSEYFDMRVIHRLRTGEYDDDWEEESEDEEEEGTHKSWLEKLKEKAVHQDDNGSKTKVEFKRGPTKYLNLTDDDAHVVEFYAPWCPHCQNYKWEYVEIADEVIRRSISPVQFHAISCDIYYAICSTYGIHGFPTIIGWKQGESKGHIGLEMNEEENIDADMVGEMLGLDMAHEAVELWDWDEDEDEESQALLHKKSIEQGHKAARTKKAWHEHRPHTHNDRYHNAALSLAFAVKSQLFQTLTEDGKMDPKRKSALLDFLNLLDWATPQSWKLRTGLIKELHWKMDADTIKNRGDVESLIDRDMARHRSEGATDLWGFVDASEKGWTGKIFGQNQEKLARDDKHWSKACTHSQPAKGFTCGLWNLFHILTIGSSKPEHELYGFHRGYFVSSHHVAASIADFVAYFFSCDVCRTNFLRMYESCGHGHCERLKSEIAVGPSDGSDPARMELALWLWEVHNSVNARLMEEAAMRQNREVTTEETMASKFPTKKLCPGCWLDENMTTWDNATVFRFLDEWYWPDDEPADDHFKSVIAGTAQLEKEGTLHADTHIGGPGAENVNLSLFSKSRLGMGFTSLFCLIAFLMFVAAAVQKKRRQRRKKFVDSRFVKKKKGCF